MNSRPLKGPERKREDEEKKITPLITAPLAHTLRSYQQYFFKDPMGWI
jgi:hypothetical protein